MPPARVGVNALGSSDQIFSNSSHKWICVQVWLRSVQWPPRLGVEKRRKKNHTTVKYKPFGIARRFVHEFIHIYIFTTVFRNLGSATVRRTTTYAVWYLLNVELILTVLYICLSLFLATVFWRWNKVIYILYLHAHIGDDLCRHKCARWWRGWDISACLLMRQTDRCSGAYCAEMPW